jgi:hypothetical protein
MAARQLLARLGVGLLVTFVLGAGVGEAAGPWKGQIVDRDTGHPIPGAVVLAIWTERSRDFIHPEDHFHSAFEAVSDEDGRFVIPQHHAVPTKPLTAIRGPQIVIFKGGYGGWAFQGGPYYPLIEDTYVRKQRIARAWEQFENDGVGVELARRMDRRERLNWMGLVRPLHVPDDKMPRLLEALDAEAVSLGLPTLRQPTQGGQIR